jgi:apolipoprotein D and lipocalin family protein
LDRYLGRWYEICRRLLKWEDETATDITATYLRPLGSGHLDRLGYSTRSAS